MHTANKLRPIEDYTMSRITTLTVVLSIITIANSHPVAERKSVMPDLNNPSTLKSISKVSQTIGSTMVDLALDHFLPTNSFTLTITNNMVKRRLIDPRIYIDNGHAVTPPPFMIPATPKPFGGERQIALLENDPAGVLCYGNEPIAGQQPRPPVVDTCVIFRAKKKYYAIYSQNGKMTSEQMKKLYSDFTNKKVTSIIPTKNTYGGFLFTDYKLFQVIAQMTSGKENLQLHFEVLDTVTSVQEALQKRVVTSIVGGLVLGGLSSLATFAFNRITADVGTTLVLENASTEDKPFNLIDPKWETNGVDLHDIIPWRIGPNERSEMTLVGPFASGNTFQRSAIALSFKIQGRDDRIVFTIWWPLKANFFKKDLNSYSVSLVNTEKSNEEALRSYLKRLVELADKNPDQFPTPVIAADVFQQYRLWKFPMPNSVNGKVENVLNVLTNMGDGRKNGMAVKLYPKPAPKNPSEDIRPLSIYTGDPNDIPPA
ncbi:uncharacterized protein LOC114526003 [Dendronephthya gigantea]|uniref:uncharacterized protein LOC114526003 n=1 Tax=Dendronephthya gigantea TaxID=151771 RepID=UPI0010692667|nr:uncharacterized protein LOC114526003 [Dendronephthya gigantea]